LKELKEQRQLETLNQKNKYLINLKLKILPILGRIFLFN
jgi:hypothetical protein